MAGCSGVPDEVIQPHDMAALMADIHLGEAVAEQSRSTFRSDSVKQLFKQSIYAKHGVTADEVDSSMMWYGRHVDKYAEIYAEVEEILEGRIAEANEVASTSTDRPSMQAFEADGDSVDIWPLYRTTFLNPNFPTDRVAFVIKSDRFWDKGDVYCLRFKGVDTPDQFDITIAVEYNEGSVDYSSAHKRGPGWQELYLHLTDTLTASQVYGVITYQPTESHSGLSNRPAARIDSISLVRMRSFVGNKLPRRGQHRLNPLR